MKALKTFGIAICAFLAFCVVVAIFDDNDSSSENKTEPQQSEQTEQKQGTKTEQKESKEVQSEQKQENSFLGTYEVTDKVGCTFRITLNEDETATITGVRGESVTYYCSWIELSALNKGIKIRFSDEKPYIVYEGGADTNEYTDVYLKDGWLYAEDGVQSKNPNWRLKATKIK